MRIKKIAIVSGIIILTIILLTTISDYVAKAAEAAALEHALTIHPPVEEPLRPYQINQIEVNSIPDAEEEHKEVFVPWHIDYLTNSNQLFGEEWIQGIEVQLNAKWAKERGNLSNEDLFTFNEWTDMVKDMRSLIMWQWDPINKDLTIRKYLQEKGYRVSTEGETNETITETAQLN